MPTLQKKTGIFVFGAAQGELSAWGMGQNPKPPMSPSPGHSPTPGSGCGAGWFRKSPIPLKGRDSGSHPKPQGAGDSSWNVTAAVPHPAAPTTTPLGSPVVESCLQQLPVTCHHPSALGHCCPFAACPNPGPAAPRASLPWHDGAVPEWGHQQDGPGSTPSFTTGMSPGRGDTAPACPAGVSPPCSPPCRADSSIEEALRVSKKSCCLPSQLGMNISAQLPGPGAVSVLSRHRSIPGRGQ